MRDVAEAPDVRGRRIIPAAVADGLLRRCQDHESALAAIRSRRASSLRRLPAAIQQAVDEGYASGVARALRDMAALQQRQARSLRDIERGMADILSSALRKLTGEVPPENVLSHRLRAAFAELGDAASAPANVAIEVHPDMADVVRQRCTEWREAGQWLPSIEIRAVDDVQLLDCRLDLGDRVHDASLLIQLDAIEKSLHESAGADT